MNNPENTTDSIKNTLFSNNTTTGTVKATSISTSKTKYGQVLGGAVYNAGELTIISGAFVNNGVIAKGSEIDDYYVETHADNEAYGGAIYNTGSITDITADFIDNYATSSASSVAAGGAIYNENDKIINSITGTFIGNNVSATNVSYYNGARGYGGAIYNGGTINEINADFINNSASSAGGGIYNTVGSKINSITGNFIENSAREGGGIYNKGEIDNITANFIANNGGAICNVSSISSITGDFIANEGPSVSNTGSITGITGDFIANKDISVSNTGSITGITGDFIANKDISVSNTGSITGITGDFIANEDISVFNTGTITNLTGDFISNKDTVISNSNSYYGIGTIENITGNFITNQNVIKNQGIITNINSNFIQNKNAIYNGGDNSNSIRINTIKGDFIENTNTAINNNLIYNSYDDSGVVITTVAGSSIIDIIESSDFIGNTGTEGGAIYNLGKINEIKDTDFIGNSAAYGGAIYNEGQYVDDYTAHAQIGNITGNFVNNHATGAGGAIYNYQDLSQASIGNITGDFIQNYVEGDGWASGGAIYNDQASIGDITGDFSQNYVLNTDGEAHGGAISNTYNATIGSKDDEGSITGGIINSNFTGNYAKSENGEAKGGAIYTTTNLNIIAKDNGQSVFSGNYTESAGVKDQNAIYVETINDSYTNTDRNIISIENNKVTFEDVTEAQAPSSTPTLTLNASTNGVIVFDDTIDGNIVVAGTNTVTKTGDLVLTDYAKEDLGFETVEEYIAYVKADGWYDEGTTDEEIIAKGLNIGDVEITNEQTVSTESKGDKYSYTLALDGDETGAIYLNNKIINANITLDNTNVFVSEGSNLASSRTLAVNSGVLNINHLADQTINFEKFSNSGNINLDNVDVNLQNKTMGRITADTYGDMSGSINVKNLTLLNDAAQNVTHVLFADPEYTNSVIYTGAPQVAYSPIWKYDVSYGTPIDNDPQGYFTFVRGDSGDSGSYNPSVLSTPVMQQAGAYVNQMQAFNYVFEHSTVFMNLPYTERLSIKERNKIALSPTGDATDIGVYSPLMLKQDLHGFWFKPYASFENIPLKNGPKVSNINYGTLIGYDSEMRTTQYGWDRVYTGYIGYNGASQRYAGVNAYQNGGILGGTVTFYKNNFFNATTVSVGATAGDATNMYGSENYTMLIAGIANKAGYNFEFWDGRMILQPSMMISYTFANTFDYNNAAGVRIESDPLNAIQLAPGIKLIGNTKNGWQPYLAVNMVWNLLDSAKVTANDVRLPEMSIRPYVQYGIGVQKNFKEDRITGYGQAMIHNGGRNGVSLTAGIRWNVGRE